MTGLPTAPSDFRVALNTTKDVFTLTWTAPTDTTVSGYKVTFFARDPLISEDSLTYITNISSGDRSDFNIERSPNVPDSIGSRTTTAFTYTWANLKTLTYTLGGNSTPSYTSSDSCTWALVFSVKSVNAIGNESDPVYSFIDVRDNYSLLPSDFRVNNNSSAIGNNKYNFNITWNAAVNQRVAGYKVSFTASDTNNYDYTSPVFNTAPVYFTYNLSPVVYNPVTISSRTTVSTTIPWNDLSGLVFNVANNKKISPYWSMLFKIVSIDSNNTESNPRYCVFDRHYIIRRSLGFRMIQLSYHLDRKKTPVIFNESSIFRKTLYPIYVETHDGIIDRYPSEIDNSNYDVFDNNMQRNKYYIMNISNANIHSTVANYVLSFDIKKALDDGSLSSEIQADQRVSIVKIADSPSEIPKLKYADGREVSFTFGREMKECIDEVYLLFSGYILSNFRLTYVLQDLTLDNNIKYSGTIVYNSLIDKLYYGKSSTYNFYEGDTINPHPFLNADDGKLKIPNFITTIKSQDFLRGSIVNTHNPVWSSNNTVSFTSNYGVALFGHSYTTTLQQGFNANLQPYVLSYELDSPPQLFNFYSFNGPFAVSLVLVNTSKKLGNFVLEEKVTNDLTIGEATPFVAQEARFFASRFKIQNGKYNRSGTPLNDGDIDKVYKILISDCQPGIPYSVEFKNYPKFLSTFTMPSGFPEFNYDDENPNQNNVTYSFSSYLTDSPASEPRNLTAIVSPSDPGKARITWDLPQMSPERVTSYLIFSEPCTNIDGEEVTGSDMLSRSFNYPNLVPGVSYTFSAMSLSNFGFSGMSNDTEKVVIKRLPQPPSDVFIAGRPDIVDNSLIILLMWVMDENNTGGSPITDYRVTSNGTNLTYGSTNSFNTSGGHAETGGSIRVTVPTSQTVTFNVFSRNARGESATSASFTVYLPVKPIPKFNTSTTSVTNLNNPYRILSSEIPKFNIKSVLTLTTTNPSNEEALDSCFIGNVYARLIVDNIMIRLSSARDNQIGRTTNNYYNNMTLWGKELKIQNIGDVYYTDFRSHTSTLAYDFTPQPSDPSTPFRVYTSCNPVTGLTATESPTQFTINWTAPEFRGGYTNVSTYYIYINNVYYNQTGNATTTYNIPKNYLEQKDIILPTGDNLRFTVTVIPHNEYSLGLANTTDELSETRDNRFYARGINLKATN
jgi:hypothetical protein